MTDIQMLVDDEQLDLKDKAALDLAMTIACRDPSRREQLEWKLEREPWIDVAEFAAYCCQGRALNLKPWEDPPCDVDDDDDESKGGKLLSKMLKAGVSRYHPDPLAALGVAHVRFRG